MNWNKWSTLVDEITDDIQGTIHQVTHFSPLFYFPSALFCPGNGGIAMLSEIRVAWARQFWQRKFTLFTAHECKLLITEPGFEENRPRVKQALRGASSPVRSHFSPVLLPLLLPSSISFHWASWWNAQPSSECSAVTQRVCLGLQAPGCASKGQRC